MSYDNQEAHVLWDYQNMQIPRRMDMIVALNLTEAEVKRLGFHFLVDGSIIGVVGLQSRLQFQRR